MGDTIGLLGLIIAKFRYFNLFSKLLFQLVFRIILGKAPPNNNSFGQPAYNKIAHSYNPGKLGAQVEVKRQRKFAINHARFSFYYYLPPFCETAITLFENATRT